MSKHSTTRGSISLYGTSAVGFAYLATVEGKPEIFGTHPGAGPMPHETATEAIWAACDALRARGVTLARVHLHDERFADLDPSSPPIFGALRFRSQ